jgi:hypothetical protein
MSDKAILEAAARALEDRWNNNRPTGGAYPFPISTGEALQAIVTAVAPLIRAAALEEAAARLLELAREERNLDGATINRAAEYLNTLRALKEQP